MISINATLIVQIINLLLLIFVLNRMMYRPIRKMIANRAASMEKGRATARALAEQASDEGDIYTRALGDGRREVRARLKKVRTEAELEARGVINLAQEKARAEADKLMAEIHGEMERARGDVKKQVEQVASKMASQLLGREVS